MSIDLVPLCEFRIRRGPRFDTGVSSIGRRAVAEVAELTVVGERLNGRLAGRAGADWATTGADGLTYIDARFTIETDDGAHILVTYTGRIDDLRKHPDVHMYSAPVFFTGDPRYRWLAGIQAVAKGYFREDDANSVVYEVYEIR
jgi:hypothetical protein